MTDNTMSNDPIWNTLQKVFLGLMVPLVAAMIPIIVERYWPSSDLEYQASEVIHAGGFSAYSIHVENDTKTPVEELEVWLPFQQLPAIDGSESVLEIDSSLPAAITESEDGIHQIVKTKRLLPGEKQTISVVFDDQFRYVSPFDLERLRITSKTAIASPKEESFISPYLYQVGAWLFVFLLIAAICVGFYLDKIMPKEKKIRLYKKQIRDAQAELAKLRPDEEQKEATPDQPSAD